MHYIRTLALMALLHAIPACAMEHTNKGTTHLTLALLEAKHGKQYAKCIVRNSKTGQRSLLLPEYVALNPMINPYTGQYFQLLPGCVVLSKQHSKA